MYECVSYLHTYIPNILHTYIPNILHTYVPNILHTYVPNILHTYVPNILHTYVPNILHTYIPNILHTYIPNILHTYIPNILHTYIPNILHTYIPNILHTYLIFSSPTSLQNLPNTSSSTALNFASNLLIFPSRFSMDDITLSRVVCRRISNTDLRRRHTYGVYIHTVTDLYINSVIIGTQNCAHDC